MSKGLLDPKVDFVFKNIFGSPNHPEILISFLNATLKAKKKIVNVDIKKTDIEKQYIEDKYSRLDVKATTSNDEIINIEIQLKNENNMVKRSLYYLSKMYEEQLNEKEDYSKLVRTVCINILNFKYLKTDNFHTGYRFKEIESNEELTDIMEVHFIEIPKLQDSSDEKDMLVAWTEFLKDPESEKDFLDHSQGTGEKSKSVMYPDITPAMRRMRFVIKLTIFCSIVVEGVLILINYLTYSKVKWSALCGIGLAYACFSLIYSFRHNKSHRKKMLVQAIFIMPVLVLVDYILGYTGWSIDFAIPCVIAMLDIAILVLMIINTENWQSYILLQVYIIIICVILTILMLTGKFFKHDFFMIIADVMSALLLGGTLVFGDRPATTELKRRFHV